MVAVHRHRTLETLSPPRTHSTRRIDRDPCGWAKFQIKNLILIHIVYFWCYGTDTGKYRAAGIRCWSQIPEGHMCLRSPDMAKIMPKMDPSAADMALAVWNGWVQDARRHARHAVTPRRAIEQDGKDVGLVGRARSRSSLCRYSLVYL